MVARRNPQPTQELPCPWNQSSSFQRFGRVAQVDVEEPPPMRPPQSTIIPPRSTRSNPRSSRVCSLFGRFEAWVGWWSSLR